MQSNDFMSIAAFNFCVFNFLEKYHIYLFLIQKLSNCLKLALPKFESNEVAQN